MSIHVLQTTCCSFMLCHIKHICNQTDSIKMLLSRIYFFLQLIRLPRHSLLYNNRVVQLSSGWHPRSYNPFHDCTSSMHVAGVSLGHSYTATSPMKRLIKNKVIFYSICHGGAQTPHTVQVRGQLNKESGGEKKKTKNQMTWKHGQ